MIIKHQNINLKIVGKAMIKSSKILYPAQCVIFGILSVFFSSQVFPQADNSSPINELILRPGETYQIQSSQSELNLQKLHLGDNSVITFADDVDHWFVEAGEVVIGKNVFIQASGNNGQIGSDSTDLNATGTNCRAGQSGEAGVAGKPGDDGVSVQLRLGLLKLETLKIDTSGGSGGNGGRGGEGQDAGQESNCEKAVGGNGGRGGAGGKGGNGASVRVSVWNANMSTKIAHDSLQNISVVAAGGEAGTAGEGGTPGIGSQGRFVNRRSLSGTRRWSPGGKGGESGVTGKLASEGSAGRIEIEEIFIGSASAVKRPAKPQSPTSPPVPKNEKNSDIEAMKKQIEALQKRLDEMENAN